MENFVHTNHKSIKTPKITNDRTCSYIWGSLYFLVEYPCPPCKKGTFGQENFQVISHASETEQKKCRKKRIFMSNVKSHPTPFPENISKLRV